jgi:hypothetical protein
MDDNTTKVAHARLPPIFAVITALKVETPPKASVKPPVTAVLIGFPELGCPLCSGPI